MVGKLPYADVRILERSSLLSGRLVGLLFADQGAEVLIEHPNLHEGQSVDDYLNRNKRAVPCLTESQLSSVDIVILDGEDSSCARLPHQIFLRTVAALPGDEVYGHLPHDVDEDFLSALTGFFTDMAMSKWLDREVIYTPLKLCSIYAGVIGAVACSAALVDRTRCGHGLEIHASRLAGGLSAIGALSLRTQGLPDHLNASPISQHRKGLSEEKLEEYKQNAIKDPTFQLWLDQRLYPFAAPYATRDGTFILPMATFNRRLAVKTCEYLKIVDQLKASGIVDADPFDSESHRYLNRNLARPTDMDFQSSSRCAELLGQAFMTKTAAEWEEELELAGLPCAKIQTFQDWMQNLDVHESGIAAHVEGLSRPQLGRTAWVSSAGRYPNLKRLHRAEKLLPKGDSIGAKAKQGRLPLEGYVVADLSNVIAGPNCGRMFAELGATVYKIEPRNPQHGPMVMSVWQAEGHQGKKSIILDMATEKGRQIMKKIVVKADIVLLNKMDHQLVSIGLDRDSLRVLNRKAIGLQLKAHQGEKDSGHSNWTGYDPALQGKTGLMTRFGPPGCPSFHGVASCVDYLTGYLSTWAGTSALYARESRGDGEGDWSGSSLAVAASLTQLTLQYEEPPASAVGPFATGMNEYNRIYRVRDGKCIYAQLGPGKRHVIESLRDKTREEAVAFLRDAVGVLAVPVQTCKEMAAVSLDRPSKTASFEKRDAGQGWVVHTWKPNWFCFNGTPVSCPGAPTRSGSDADAILREIGCTDQETKQLRDEGVVCPTEWIFSDHASKKLRSA